MRRKCQNKTGRDRLKGSISDGFKTVIWKIQRSAQKGAKQK